MPTQNNNTPGNTDPTPFKENTVRRTTGTDTPLQQVANPAPSTSTPTPSSPPTSRSEGHDFDASGGQHTGPSTQRKPFEAPHRVTPASAPKDETASADASESKRLETTMTTSLTDKLSQWGSQAIKFIKANPAAAMAVGFVAAKVLRRRRPRR